MSDIWMRAQQFESQHWIVNRDVIFSQKYREQIGKRSERVELWIREFGEINDQSILLEIGGGATQLLDFFHQGLKYAIDPLADFYQKEFSDILNPGIIWSVSKAEEIPYPDEFFDVIIMRNVLDHVDSVDKTLSEMRRVLKPKGLVYLGLNTFSGLLYLYKLIVKDVGHPFTFTPSNIKTCLKRAKFNIVDAISDAPENMSHFSDQMVAAKTFRGLIRKVFLRFHFYHFDEFLLRKI